MQLREREEIDGDYERITVVPDTLDDIWHLQYIIEPGDRVAGETHRRIQRNDEQMRDTGGQREHLWLSIAVESVEFHRFANRLRIGGEIVACSREDQIGFHHTINVEIHDEISIQKRFKTDQLQRLEDAIEATNDPDVAIATVEDGKAAVYTVNQFGPEERTVVTGPSGKGEYARNRNEFFEELGTVLSRTAVESIVLAGPGFTKQNAYDYIAESHPELAEHITLVDTSSAGDRGVHEVLQRGALEDIRSARRIANESKYIDELLEHIANNGPATYGIDAVTEAAEYGAIDRLLILDEQLRSERVSSGDWSTDIDSLLRQVEQKGGEVVIVSSEFEPGQRLSNLGGIAALLRYRIE